METVKGKLLALETKIKELESKINSVSGVTPKIEQNNHTVFPNEEFIEYNLFEELQTLKFAYKQKVDHGKTGRKYFEYYLLNPTEEMEAIVGKINIIMEYESPIQLMSFCDSPENLEDYGYEIIVKDLSGPLSNEINRNKIKKELDKYFFQVADICNCNIRPTIFPKEISIRFRNEYERLPHISYYLTPFQDSLKVKSYIKEITKKQVIIIFTQHHAKGERCILPKDQYYTPEDIQLHMHVRGLQKKESVDLLLETS
jgi:hypothetical protein